jgi:hypothetical protein
MVNETIPRARCRACGRALLFADWRRGVERCAECERAAAPARPAAASDYRQHQRMLDEIPEELIEELVASLEAEAAKLEEGAAPAPASPLREVLEEFGLGRDGSELSWTAWGFAFGFGLNVALAKYAQMSSGASFGSFVVPLLIGGVVAGFACGAIGWGLARLRASWSP